MQAESKFSINFDYLTTVLASWLIPGAGHWILGYRLKAVILFVALNSTFWMGQFLGDFRPVNRAVHNIFYWGQVGNGLATVVSNQMWGGKRRNAESFERVVDRTLPTHLNTGILFTSVSGLLNMLLILYVADPKTWMHRSRRSDAGEKTAPLKTPPKPGK